MANYKIQLTQDIFSNKKDCLANIHITGWSQTGRTADFCKRAVAHLMFIIEKKAGDISGKKPAEILKIYDRMITELSTSRRLTCLQRNSV